MTYRVTFLHAQHRTKFELRVIAPRRSLATRAGWEILGTALNVYASGPLDWIHLSTIGEPPETGDNQNA